jgi:drug/metabolite transporter (DMT)-like permease
MRLPASTRTKSLLYIWLSNLLFSCMAVAVGGLSDRFDGYFSSFFRFLVGVILGFSQLAAMKRPFRVRRWRPWLGRGIFGAVSMILYFVSIALCSPGRASLLNNSFPVFVAIISVVFLRARLSPATAAGVAVAFSGIAVVLWDGAASSIAGNLAGLASGILAGLSYHFNKRASQTEDPIVIYLGVCFAGLIGTCFSAGQFARLDLVSTLLLAAGGLGGYFAQIAITIGLKDIDATEGSMHTFGKIPLTVLAGWAFLSERISPRFIVGTALVLMGLLLDKALPPGLYSGRRKK